jgi:hypothetical protein
MLILYKDSNIHNYSYRRLLSVILTTFMQHQNPKFELRHYLKSSNFIKIPKSSTSTKTAINLLHSTNGNSNKCDEIFQNFRMTFFVVKSSYYPSSISKIVFIPKCLLMFLLLIFIRLIMLKRSWLVLSHRRIVY